MEYTVTQIENGIATIEFSDGGWTHVQLNADMTEADLDDLIHLVAPPHLKTGETPSFLQKGASRTAAKKPEEAVADPRPDWQVARQLAYGSLESQIEYITENGLAAWQARVAEIKADNPKE